VEFVLYGPFVVSPGASGEKVCEAAHQHKEKSAAEQSLLAAAEGGKVVINGEAREEWYFASGGQYSDYERLLNNRSYCSDGSDNQQLTDTQRVCLQGDSFFTLKNVKIGKGFHWERFQDQSFPGDLKLIARDGCVIAINVVGIEDYLQCVIASEMSPTAGFEFLKAHAVISRSWLLAQLDKRDEVREGYSSVECDTPDELIRWQDREDHEWFDFCADDHCQRYQGIPQGNPAMVRKTKRVIEATWGQVLWYDGRVCDARFSKCCGGALEEFKYCWENKDVPYLKYARDYDRPAIAGSISAAGAQMDLREEKSARKWILSHPRAFCNTRSRHLLGQVLKDYDSETKDFYRWKVEYSAEELRQIILERTGDDYGDIIDLVPLERGVSGRICRLKIVGSKKTKIIGKELEIRKTLSRSHLYSSAFVVEKVYIAPATASESLCLAAFNISERYSPAQSFPSQNVAVGSGAEEKFAKASISINKKASRSKAFPEQSERNTKDVNPSRFILYGAGWGHGVGLCQIGAAAMGARGYDYLAILQHYYPNSTLKNIY
jgi:SpoIID/LytB domain protein